MKSMLRRRIIFIAIFYHSRERSLGAREQFFETRLFHVRETPFFESRGQYGNGCSFTEKGRGLDLQEHSPSCAPAWVPFVGTRKPWALF